MMKTIKTRQFKLTALVLALVLTVSCALWNTTKVHALEITDANAGGYTVYGGYTVMPDGELVGTAGSSANIGVYVTGVGLEDKYLGNNIKWTHDGTGWDSGTQILHKGSGAQQMISAYYPYVDWYTSGGVNYELTAIQTAETLVNDDLLYAAANNLNTAKTTINFNHLMTKLSVNITGNGSEIATGATVSEVKISGLATTATFYPENGTLTAGNDLTGTTVAYNNGTTYDALVFPASYSTITVTVTMSTDQVFTTTVTCPQGGLAGGTQYNIKLQVGQDKVTLGGITIKPWEQDTGNKSLETE